MQRVYLKSINLLRKLAHLSFNKPKISVVKFQAFSSTTTILWQKKFSKKLIESALLLIHNMNDPASKEILAPLQAAVKEQGDLVRQLKADKAPENDIKLAVTELKARKKKLEDKVLEISKMEEGEQIDRAKLEDLLKQRFFYDMSFSIYGGVTGLYDFGPMGCMVKTNLIQSWRDMFVLEEQMLEVDCTMLTPETVLKASGHAERFADTMIKDLKSGECFRADHLINAAIEKMLVDKKVSAEKKEELRKLIPFLESMTKEQMKEVIKQYTIKSPTTGSELSEPMDFNLMFDTSIGPASKIKGFLRPETAQGIFVNFKRLLDFNAGKLPFAAAQIGTAFRNEISPRSGLIRVREFTMAEIEHFVDTNDKTHPKFDSVSGVKVPLYSACAQMDGKLPVEMTLQQALKDGTISNETLAYFLGRIYLFMVHIGLDPRKIRFRQHLSNEMAHYAKDCWDAEVKTTYGWVECVGCADRSCFDLQQHSQATGVKLVAEKKLDTPVSRTVVEVNPIKATIGKRFKKDAKPIQQTLATLSPSQINEIIENLETKGSHSLKVNDSAFDIDKEVVEVKKYTKTFHVEEITPSVIEPSFGIGRLMYALFEHNFKVREGDEQRTYLTLPPVIAPYKCSVLPLSNNAEFQPFIRELSKSLTREGVSHKVDTSSTAIGRRYARTDQIAIPFGITVDFDSLKEPHTATLRERDSMKQIRASMSELPEIIRDLSLHKRTWKEVTETYPVFEQQENTK